MLRQFLINNWIGLFTTAAAIIAAISLTLSYISQRHSMIDTPYEREKKIYDGLRDGSVNVQHFTSGKYDIEISLVKIKVIDDRSLLQKGIAILNPFGSLEGKSLVKFHVENGGQMDDGDYELIGDSPDGYLLRGVTYCTSDGRKIALELDTIETEGMMYKAQTLLMASYYLTLESIDRDNQTMDDLLSPEGMTVERYEFDNEEGKYQRIT